MAESPAHRVGQIIGYALEKSVFPLLQDVADEHELYLDKAGMRPVRGKRKLLGWVDSAGNNHNLDFVLERNGSPVKLGTPVAFIEVAWRRYTKHSVNKAGEIANALVPLRQTYSRMRPFTGAVVAGVWTEGGLQHMRSQGIAVLYVPLSEIVAAFAAYGVDVDLGEDTSEAYQQRQITAWEALTVRDQENLARSLMSQSPDRYAAFRAELDAHLRRQITRVLILPLHGETLSFSTPEEAILALQEYEPERLTQPLVRFEIQIRYSNGDKIDAEFGQTADAIAFLEAQG